MIIYAQSIAYSIYLSDNIWAPPSTPSPLNLLLSNLYGIENSSIVIWELGKLDPFLVSVIIKTEAAPGGVL